MFLSVYLFPVQMVAYTIRFSIEVFRYLGWFVSKCISKYFGFKSVKFEKLRPFHLSYAKFVLRDGLAVEVHDLRLSSSFFNQEHT